MTITKDIRYIGVDDHDIDLFEGMYDVPNGMAYNSYVILDEKIAVMDTVEVRFGAAWMAKLDAVLDGRTPDYLIVHHVEPDHSANITAFMDKYPQATIVASAQAFRLIANFYGTDYAARRIVAADGATVSLGSHVLNFVTAPMVHWPEVIMSYESTDKVLFSADAFGKFGAQDYDDPEGWSCEARRYYFGIVGKFGAQVQALLKKLAGKELAHICSLHGPVLSGDLSEYLRLYNIWSSYEVETEGVLIAYTTVYGHTREAAEYLAEKLRGMGVRAVITDLARDDQYEAVEDAFRHSKLVLCTTTYNTGVFPVMREFIQHLTDRGYQKRTVALVENGGWAPMAAKGMRAMLEGCKNLTFAETPVKIMGALTPATFAQLDKLAQELA
ncbi:MAG: flavodoxin domain-containing protein [Oscillospiraceae bacterium]|nr:flavodoxin domain-containing protein [Oscillospiraceae bacterium]